MDYHIWSLCVITIGEHKEGVEKYVSVADGGDEKRLNLNNKGEATTERSVVCVTRTRPQTDTYIYIYIIYYKRRCLYI